MSTIGWPGPAGQLRGLARPPPGSEGRASDCISRSSVASIGASNSARTPGSDRIRSRASSACPGTYPLPISMVRSAAHALGAERAAAKEVAMEKKMTVPPGAVARIAPPSQPGTSTHTTVTSAGPPAARDRRRHVNRVPGVGALTTWSASAARAAAAASASCGTTPMTRRAPARRAAAADSDPLLPAAPGMATTGAPAPALTDAPGQGRARRRRRARPAPGRRAGHREARRRWTGRTGSRGPRRAPAPTGRPSEPARR